MRDRCQFDWFFGFFAPNGPTFEILISPVILDTSIFPDGIARRVRVISRKAFADDVRPKPASLRIAFETAKLDQ